MLRLVLSKTGCACAGRFKCRHIVAPLPLPLLQVVSFGGWQRVDAEEVRRGQALGKPRDKIVNVEEMLQIARAA